MPRFSENELDVLSCMKEALSAVCCAANYVVRSDEGWEEFRTWLLASVSKRDSSPAITELMEAEVRRDTMMAAIAQADQMLIATEEAEVEDLLAQEDFRPFWMD